MCAKPYTALPPALVFAILSMMSLCNIAWAQNALPDSLSLRSFLEQVEKAHPSLQQAALERDVAEADILNARGSFDLFLKGKYELKNSEGKDKINLLDAGVEMPFATMFGPRVSAGIKRGDGSAINPESSTSGATEVGVGVSLPLWQGINTDSRRTNLEKARLRPELAEISLSQEKNNLYRAAALRYWDWVESYEQLRVATALASIAEERFRQIARRAAAGEVAGIDSIEALQEAERRRGERIRAERLSEQAAIAATVFLWQSDGKRLNQQVSPALLPPREELSAQQIERDKANALRSRPEIRRLSVQERLAEFDVRLAKELQRPLIEAQGQFLAQPFSPEKTNSLKIGLSVSQPLFFRSAEAQDQLAAIGVQRLSYQRQVVERQIQAESDDALSALQKATERIAAAERETQLALTMQQAELKRFTAGESTLLVVNIRERALAEAQARLVTARADYFRAMASYRWATMSW